MKNLLLKIFSGLPDVYPVSGGCIHQTFVAEYQKKKYFIKYHPHCKENFFSCEADGLAFLKQHSSFRIPEILGCFYEKEQGMLVMEFIASGSRTPAYYSRLGEKLALMHKKKGDFFGYFQPNFVGTLEQTNVPASTWAEFYVEHRLKPFYDILEMNQDDPRWEKITKKIHRHTAKVFPSPLHGDLWSGNHLADENENPVLVDPAVYFGDRTIDLAMLELFGRLAPEFHRAYYKLLPADENWEFRMKLSTLYPLLVHSRLFGGHYIRESKKIFEEIV